MVCVRAGWRCFLRFWRAVNIPFSKLLLGEVSPTMPAGLLYLGAGVGMGSLLLGRRMLGIQGRDAFLTRRDLPFTVAMVVPDIAAPVLLMFGISYLQKAVGSHPFGGGRAFAAAWLVFCGHAARICVLWVEHSVLYQGAKSARRGKNKRLLFGRPLPRRGLCL